ncbi:MAG: amidohydrolase/deacetylase family metallohydrolase [Chloroflexota bacterium]|nr:amidohydrolase/deacetylase family metallohydrolase [Chloroflexota bacterium]
MSNQERSEGNEAVKFDILLKGGHLIDPKNGLSECMDVAMAEGQIAAVDEDIPEETARDIVDVSGMYVTPGLIDMHVHVHIWSEWFGMMGIRAVVPDAQSWKVGITTMVDAGTAGPLDFGRFKERVIDKSRTRILAYVNISDQGMGGAGEQTVANMRPELTAGVCKAFPKDVVGVKTAHYWTSKPWDKEHPPWASVERAVEAGELCQMPVMVDFWPRPPERPYEELILEKLRPGDIHTHVFAQQHPIILDDGSVNPALFEARDRGIIFDVGHGAGSFWFRNAVQALEQGFLPDSFSTDLHTGNAANGLCPDLLNVCNKFLNIGMSLDDVISRVTVAPAREIGRPELGHLSVGAVADIAVLRVREGEFGFFDCGGAKIVGDKKIECALTYQGGELMYDADGLTMPHWKEAPPEYWTVNR